MPLPVTYTVAEASADRVNAESSATYYATIQAGIAKVAASGDTTLLPSTLGGLARDACLVILDISPNTAHFPLVSSDLSSVLGYTVAYTPAGSGNPGFWLVSGW